MSSSVNAILSRPHLLLGALMAELCLASLATRGGIDDWQFFDWGGRMLFGQHTPFVRPQYDVDPDLPGGLHLYGSYPILQIGPPALVVARLAALAPGGGRAVVLAIIAALGLFTVYAVDRAFRPSRWLVLGGGALVVVAWAPLLRAAHLDDAMALAGLAGAAWGLRSGRALTSGVCLGMAATAKPWAAVLLPLAFAMPEVRNRVKALSAATGVVLAGWGPFIVADHGTLRLGQQARVIGRGTPFELLHWLPAMQTLRLAQFVVGLLLVGLLTVRGRWELGALCAFSLRLLLEPNAFGYYSAATVLAAFMVDCARGRRLPVLTFVVAALSVVAGGLASTPAGALRLGLYAGLLLIGLAAVVGRPGSSWRDLRPRRSS